MKTLFARPAPALSALCSCALCSSVLCSSVLWLAVPGFAAPPTAAPAPAAQRVQADGIAAAVVDRLWRQTDGYWHEGDYPRIVALDRIITEADPQFLEAYATGGWLMDSLGRTADAEAYYTLGTRRNPRAAYAYWNLGFFYFNTTHDYAAAARAFRSDTQQADADLNDWKMLGHSYEKAGEWQEAVATWRAAKRRWPQASSVDRLLRECLEKQARATTDRKPL